MHIALAGLMSKEGSEETIEKRRRASRTRWAKKGASDRQSAAMKRAWKGTGYHERMSEAQRLSGNPEKSSARLKADWKNITGLGTPEMQEKRTRGIQKAQLRQLTILRHAIATTRSWADGEMRGRRVAGMATSRREGRARNFGTDGMPNIPGRSPISRPAGEDAAVDSMRGFHRINFKFVRARPDVEKRRKDGAARWRRSEIGKEAAREWMKRVWKDPANAERMMHGVEAMLAEQDRRKWATTPERIVGSILAASQIQYETQRRIGRTFSDFFIPPNIHVMVDGCYWHGCPEHFPSSSEGDTRVARKLRADAEVNRWFAERPELKLVRIWEHDVKSPPDWFLEAVGANRGQEPRSGKT